MKNLTVHVSCLYWPPHQSLDRAVLTASPALILKMLMRIMMINPKLFQKRAL